jgi:hypothetical protein
MSRLGKRHAEELIAPAGQHCISEACEYLMQMIIKLRDEILAPPRRQSAAHLRGPHRWDPSSR